MCRNEVLVVLDRHLNCTAFLKVDFGTENQLRVKDPPKLLIRKAVTKLWLKLLLFLQK